MNPRASRYNSPMSPMAANKKRRVLFVCRGNACRSLMAESIARQLASDIMEPSSAGVCPLGSIPELTKKTLISSGYTVDGLYSKMLRYDALMRADVIVNMSGQSLDGVLGFHCRPSSMQRVETWNIKDPYGEQAATYQKILLEIEGRVLLLARRLRAKHRAAHA
jgi:arsenate reductase (thioredoxin)